MIPRIFAILAISAVTALTACDDGDRKPRRGRSDPRTEEPRAGEPASVDFRSTTGSGVEEDPQETFHIPRCGSGKLGYVTTRWPAPLAGSVMRVEYTVTASSDAEIVGYEHRNEAGRMALHFQRDRDDFGQSKYDRGYRQWSHARQILAPGDASFEVPLTLDEWTAGGGQRGFDAARNDVENVGFTLSDNQTAGHGVCMASGSAKLTVRAFSVD